MTGPEDPFVKRPTDPGAAASTGAAPAYGSPAYGSPAYGPPGYGPTPPGYRTPSRGGAPAYGPPQGQGQPGWGPPPGAVQETCSRAIVVLVLSICSFVVFPFVPAVVALFLAPGARSEIRRSGGRLGGEGLVSAGVIVSWINIAISTVLAIAVVGLVVVAVGSGTSAG